MAIVGFMCLIFYTPSGLESKQQNKNIDGLEYKQMSNYFYLIQCYYF